MADMMELDNILEDDLISALENFETAEVDSTKEEIKVVETKAEEKVVPNQIIEQTNNKAEPSLNLEASNNNLNSIGKFLQELLNNKTLEITIKLKDN